MINTTQLVDHELAVLYFAVETLKDEDNEQMTDEYNDTVTDLLSQLKAAYIQRNIKDTRFYKLTL